MSALPVNFDPYQPIPNTPFYSPYAPYIQGPFGPLVIGSGLTVSLNGTISATGGGGGGGTVTSVTAGAGLTGGVITTAGTIALGLSGAVAGTYSYPALSVDVYGRVTSISSGSPVTGVSVNLPLQITGSPTSPTISIQQASTAQVGATQLNNTTSSSLTNQALTAAAGKSLQDQINALAQNSNGLILAGTLNATTGNVINATTAGNLAGFTAGSPVPAASPAINDYYLIVTTGAASYTPTGGSAILNVIVGDYILVASGAWTILRVGPVAGAYATTTTAGIVELATSAEAITGTDPNLVLTPFTATTAFVTKNSFTAKGQILAGTGSSTYSALPLGIDGYVLTADSSFPNGVKWAAGGGGGGGATINMTFQAPLSSSTNPYVGGSTLIDIADATTAACGVVQLADNAQTSAGTATTLAVTPAGAASVYFPYCEYTVKGQIAVASGNNAYEIVNVGADGAVLTACSTASSGVCWSTVSTPAATPTVLGTMFGLGTPGAGANFAVGSNSLQSVSSGLGNSAAGYAALPQLTSGCYNAALGVCALYSETTGNFNTALGTGALQLQNGASQNTAIGYGTGNSITTGLANTLVGAVAGDVLTTGGCNVLVGVNAGLALTTSNNNVMVGTNSGCNSTGSANVFIGCGAALNATTQSNQIVLGAGNSCTLGTANGGVTFAFGASCFLYASAGSAVWTSASDARLKEEVADLALGLDFVNQIQPRIYQWKENKEKAAGFVAQELQEVVVEHDASYLGLVDADNEYMGVAPAALIPVLVKAIQELSAEVAELKAKLN